MITEKDIFKFLEDNKIKSDDVVLVHTSMRALGEVEGGCDGLIDAFIKYLSNGLFIVPTHTWLTVGNTTPIFDVRSEKPCIGALPTVAAFRKDGVRSLHPTHSVVAFGKNAEEFVSGEENCKTPCPKGGLWQRLLDVDAKILLLGVGLNSNTYIHAVDEMLDLPDRLAKPIPITVIDREGKEYSLSFSKHGRTGSNFFENYRKPLEWCGALENAYLNGATVGIFHTKKATEVLKNLWKRADYNLCQEKREIPEEYYK